MKTIQKTITAILIMSSVMLLTVGCSSQSSPDPLTQSNLKLGTLVSISLFDHKENTIMNQLFDRLDEIEQHMSLNIAQSELNAINESAGKGPVAVSEDTYTVIESALDFAKLSSGRFDVTIGPLVELWGIGSDDARLPAQAEIDALLPLIDYHMVQMNKDTLSVYLPQAGMKLDLGAIAKGYAADELVRILNENQVDRAIINLGGNIYAKGNKAEEQKWRVGVQNPFDSRGAYAGVVSIENETVVTSGIYERFIEVDGIRYHHILNPFDGYSIDNELASVTIVTHKSIDADAYSTILFASGLEEGLKLANENEAIMAVFITKDKEVYLSDGMEAQFELTDTTFKLME